MIHDALMIMRTFWPVWAPLALAGWLWLAYEAIMAPEEEE